MRPLGQYLPLRGNGHPISRGRELPQHRRTALFFKPKRFGQPFAVLDLADERARDVYGRDLILVRPDLHVVWRGNAPPADPAGIDAPARGLSFRVACLWPPACPFPAWRSD